MKMNNDVSNLKSHQNETYDIINAYLTGSYMNLCVLKPKIYSSIKVSYPTVYKITDKATKLVFSEMPIIETSNAENDVKLSKLLKQTEIKSIITQACFYQVSYGESIIKFNFRDGLPKFEVVSPNNYLILKWDWEKPLTVKFTTNLSKGYVYEETRYETHITHILLKNGVKTNLTNHENTKDLEDTEDWNLINDSFIWVKSSKIASNSQNKRGTPLFDDQTLTLVDKLNVFVNSQYKEGKIKQPTLIMDRDLFEPIVAENGDVISFEVNYDKEAIIAVDDDVTVNGQKVIKQIDWDLQFDKYDETFNKQLNAIYEALGFSIRNSSNMAKNEMEIESENKDSFESKHALQLKWELYIIELLQLIVEVSNNFEMETINIDFDTLTISWQDSLRNDMTTKTQNIVIQLSSLLISQRTAIKSLNPDWTSARVDEELRLINSEQSAKSETMLNELLGDEEIEDDEDGA